MRHEHNATISHLKKEGFWHARPVGIRGGGVVLDLARFNGNLACVQKQNTVWETPRWKRHDFNVEAWKGEKWRQKYTHTNETYMNKADGGEIWKGKIYLDLTELKTHWLTEFGTMKLWPNQRVSWFRGAFIGQRILSQQFLNKQTKSRGQAITRKLWNVHCSNYTQKISDNQSDRESE